MITIKIPGFYYYWKMFVAVISRNHRPWKRHFDRARFVFKESKMLDSLRPFLRHLFFFNNLKNLFIFSCAGSSLLHGFFSCSRQGLLFLALCRLLIPVASYCGPQAWGHWASVVVARGLDGFGSLALEHRLGSCGQWTELLRGVWDLPGSGIEPESRALLGRFFTTEPPGKSLTSPFLSHKFLQYYYGMNCALHPKVDVLPAVPQNITLLVNRVIADFIS